MNTNGNGATGMPTLAPADARLKGMLNSNGPLQDASATIGGNSNSGQMLNSFWNGYQYPYQWQGYYPDYNFANRVASLEGEVRVLREMVAALLSGKAPKASSAKR